MLREDQDKVMMRQRKLRLVLLTNVSMPHKRRGERFEDVGSISLQIIDCHDSPRVLDLLRKRRSHGSVDVVRAVQTHFREGGGQ